MADARPLSLAVALRARHGLARIRETDRERQTDREKESASDFVDTYTCILKQNSGWRLPLSLLEGEEMHISSKIMGSNASYSELI